MKNIKKYIIICLLVSFTILLGASKCYAVNVNPGGTVTVNYTISSPDGTNLSTVMGQLSYDSNLLECTQLTASAGYARNGRISATESQINGTSITVTATYKIKEGVSNQSISTSINLSELYTVSSDNNKAGSPIVASINVTAGGTSGNSSSGSSSSSGSTTGSSTTSEPEEESSNANLSNLGIRPNDFSGFTPGTTTYNVTVPEDVESVEVYATAQDSNATISGTGNKTLEYGENALSVVVTAEDGTTKTYTINVTREGEGETEEETEVVNGLSNITIGDLQLNPSFKTDVYEYIVKYIGEDTSLDIQAVATDPSYTVEIVGNEELKEGENTITILVTDSEGNNVATYQLTVDKSLVDEEALAREEAERKQQEQRRMFMIAGGIIAVILIIVIIIVIKRRRNRAYAEEFSGVPFAGINDEDEYDNNYDDYGNYDNDNQFDNYHDENVNGQSDFLQENYDNQTLSTEETNKENNQEMTSGLAFEDGEEKREKEKAKRDFLEGYNSDYTDEYEEDKPRRSRKKGKRFK